MAHYNESKRKKPSKLRIGQKRMRNNEKSGRGVAKKTPFNAVPQSYYYTNHIINNTYITF